MHEAQTTKIVNILIKNLQLTDLYIHHIPVVQCGTAMCMLT